MRRLFGGGFGPGVTFWSGTLLGVVLLAVAGAVLVQASGLTEEGAEAVFFALAAVYCGLMLRALLRSCRAAGGPTDWQWFGLFMVAGTLAGTALSLIVLALPYELRPRFALHWEIRALNDGLPEEAGEGITLMRVDMPDAGTVVFYYRARDPAEPGDIGATVDLNAAPGAADNCAAFDPWFRQGVAQVVFDYTHPNGGVRETLSGAACRGVSV